VGLVGFIIRIYHDARSAGRQFQTFPTFAYESYSTANFIADSVITIHPT